MALINSIQNNLHISNRQFCGLAYRYHKKTKVTESFCHSSKIIGSCLIRVNVISQIDKINLTATFLSLNDPSQARTFFVTQTDIGTDDFCVSQRHGS